MELTGIDNGVILSKSEFEKLFSNEIMRQGLCCTQAVICEETKARFDFEEILKRIIKHDKIFEIMHGGYKLVKVTPREITESGMESFGSISFSENIGEESITFLVKLD